MPRYPWLNSRVAWSANAGPPPARPVAEEFGKIPFDRRASSPLSHFQEFVQRVRRRAVDLDLADHGKTHRVIVLAERGDLGRVARLLPPNWLQGKPSTAKPRGAYFRCNASSPLYCGVKPQALAVLTIKSTCPSNRRSADLAAVERLGGEIEDGGHQPSSCLYV